MEKSKAKARILSKEDALRLRYQDPPRTIYIWLDDAMGTKYLDFGTVDLAPGEHPPDHAHDIAEEVMWVHRGRGIVRIDGEEFPVEEGMVVFAPPGVRHQFVNTGDEMMTIAYAYAPSGTEAQFLLRKDETGAISSTADLPGPGTPSASPTRE